ncbi:hypothetical protein DXG01_006704 [Tephrocybe rancida]|nr:hypothetical protein DXG01_006704 [Tephrocybe rancida]
MDGMSSSSSLSLRDLAEPFSSQDYNYRYNDYNTVCIRADSPVLGFESCDTTDDPLRYPTPGFPRNLCDSESKDFPHAKPALRTRASTLSLSHPRNAVYLDPEDASLLFHSPTAPYSRASTISMASISSISSTSSDAAAALLHIRDLYASPARPRPRPRVSSQVYLGPPPSPASPLTSNNEPTSSRWSTTSSILAHSPPPLSPTLVPAPAPCSPTQNTKRKRFTSIISRLSIGAGTLLASPPPPPNKEIVMREAYLERDDPPAPIELVLNTKSRSHTPQLSVSSSASSLRPPPPPPPKPRAPRPTLHLRPLSSSPAPSPSASQESYIDAPGAAPDASLGDLTFRASTPSLSPTPSLASLSLSPVEPRRDRVRRELAAAQKQGGLGLRKQQSMSTLASHPPSHSRAHSRRGTLSSHSSFSLSTSSIASPPTSPSSGIAFPTSCPTPSTAPTTPCSAAPTLAPPTPQKDKKDKAKRSRRTTGLRALSTRFGFRSKSPAPPLPLPAALSPVTSPTSPYPSSQFPPAPPSKRSTIMLVLPPSPRGPPPLPPKDTLSPPAYTPSPTRSVFGVRESMYTLAGAEQEQEPDIVWEEERRRWEAEDAEREREEREREEYERARGGGLDERGRVLPVLPVEVEAQTHAQGELAESELPYAFPRPPSVLPVAVVC